MPFNRTPEGRIDQRRFGGHTRDHGKAPVRRACYAADRTGHMILQTLYQNCVKHDVQFFNEFYALDLVLTQTPSGPVATGVVAYELATGEIHIFHAKAVLFATGGWGQMYEISSNAHSLTGDGIGGVLVRGFRLRTWNFSSSTRRAFTKWASCSPKPPARRGRSTARPTTTAPPPGGSRPSAGPT